MRFTLDTNCIIDIEENRPNHQHLSDLVKLHKSNDINVAVSAISASEWQQTAEEASDFKIFQQKLSNVGFSELEILLPPMYWGISSYWGYWVWLDENDTLERDIHNILFPAIEFLWVDYVAAHNKNIDAVDNIWRNAKCDVLALWCHIKNDGDIFVTSDSNFYKSSKIELLQNLGTRKVASPSVALEIAKQFCSNI